MTTGEIFNMRNSLLLTWSLPTEEIFQVHSQNRPMVNLPVFDFRSQPRDSLFHDDINKAPQYVTLGFSFRIWFSSPSTKHNLKNNHRLRMVKTLPFTHQPVRVARKASECQQLTGDMKHT